MTGTAVPTSGAVPLASWRDVYFGRAAVDAIVAAGEPVYGVNTGFGRLSSVRIEAADLAALQRNIVLSHAAWVGAPLPATVVRLVMALKVASLGQGASGLAWDRLALLDACLAQWPRPRGPVDVIGIELPAAAQGCDFHAPLTSSVALERARVPTLADDRHLAPDIAEATALVRSGALAEAVGLDLPTVDRPA